MPQSSSLRLTKATYTSAQRSEFLDKVPWSKEFSWKQIELIADRMQTYEVNKGVEIFNDNTPERYMCLIIKGSVNIVKKDSSRGRRVITTFERGHAFGEMSLVDEEPRSAAAVAAEDTLLLILTQESFAQILHTYHALGVKLLMKITRMLSQRLRSTSGMLTDALESKGEQEFFRMTS